MAGSLAPEGDQSLTADTDQRSAFSFVMFSITSVRGREGNKKKAFILGDVIKFLNGFAHNVHLIMRYAMFLLRTF